MEISRIRRTRRGGARATSLAHGQTVRGRVIADLGEGRFRVGAAGQVFEATSDLPLEPGQKLFARVEVQGWRVYLRILEDGAPRRRLAPRRENAEEIRRVLTGLGHKPDTDEVARFQRRLERCTPHGYLPDYEPSDVWILAILWTRGIRAGADAFALLSFYLRQLGLEKTPFDAKLPPPSLILDHLGADSAILIGDSELSRKCPPARGSNEWDQALLARKTEAAEMLNSGADSPARYLSFYTPEGSFHLLRSSDSGHPFYRWTNHPVLPDCVIEMTVTEDGVRIELNALADTVDSFFDSCEIWESLWHEDITRRGLTNSGVSLLKHADSQTLRFLFWRI